MIKKSNLEDCPIIEMKNVSLQIPLMNKSDFSLKRKIIKSVTGGGLSRNKDNSYVNALNSVDLTVRKGEKIALIGHNGSGKTTFIRLISGIYQPTFGSLKISVKVYPMIERSFIVEEQLTGVDSAKAHYLMMNNSLKGFQSFLEDITEFSGLGDYIYLPLKTYSEGMSARLMFSLLTYKNHECLALDEGLGTGDREFYDKAQVRLNDFLESSGSLFIASHSTELLRRFCMRGIVFSGGNLIFDGDINEALDFYEKFYS